MMTADAFLEDAFAHHGQGRYEVAAILYREVLDRDADNLNALQLLGAIAIGTSRHDDAVAWLKRAAHVLEARDCATEQHGVLYHNLGNALVATGRIAEAIASYRRGLLLAPGMPELSSLLAAALVRNGDLPAAVHAYEAALLLCPDQTELLLKLGDVHAVLGEFAAATQVYHRVMALDPDDSGAQQGLGFALLAIDRPAEAIPPLVKLSVRRPVDPSIHYALGRARFAAGEFDAAAASVTRVLDLRPEDAEAHWMMGRLAEAQRDFTSAETAYRAALARAPDLPAALFDLGTLLYREREQARESLVLFDRLIAVVPDHVSVHCARGNALRVLRLRGEALLAYQQYLQRVPDSPLAHLRLGQALAEDGQATKAVDHLTRALELEHDQNIACLAHTGLGSALLALGHRPEGLAHFRAALRIEPFTTHKAAQSKADFTALFVLAPGAYNTPYEYLIDRTAFDSHILLLLPDHEYDVDFIASHADVVVNLVSDIDQDGAMVPLATALIDRVGKPVINHPNRIYGTDRVAIGQRLSGLPSCRVASVERHSGPTLMMPTFFEQHIGGLPVLARRVGCHGGDAFERIDTRDDLRRLVSSSPESDYFVIEYIDYRSVDGYFRKYRFFMVGDAVFPYHLAIGSDWKVHHFRTDMPTKSWMRREEEAFLQSPEAVFEPRHFAALRAIRDAIGLDFFGVDCGLDRAGNLVVFEANATMLVHADSGDFAYKNPYVERIKAAFGTMLASAAGPIARQKLKGPKAPGVDGRRTEILEAAL